MDQAGRAVFESDSSESSVSPRFRIGAYLRHQRELRGLTPEELARTTRIPLRSLERLEAGRFDDDVDGFVRGFVRTVAEALGLNPDETVARMLHEPELSRPEASPARPAPNLGRSAILLVVLGSALLIWGFVQLVVSPAPPTDGPRVDSVFLRVDPVRVLAEAEAVRGQHSANPAISRAPDDEPPANPDPIPPSAQGP